MIAIPFFRKKIMIALAVSLLMYSQTIQAQGKSNLALNPSTGKHTFALSSSAFLLDNKPFQMISGEMHPARIPKEYWRHRIQMAKAMGCNTIAAYLFWNTFEKEPGKFDFTTSSN